MRTKRVIALSLVVIFIISIFGGCSKSAKNAGDVANEQKESGAMGRYLEAEIALPEGMKRILDIQLLSDGSISGIMGAEEGPLAIWTTSDYGQNWNEQSVLSVEDAETEFIADATLGKDGSVLYILYKTAEAVEEEYWKLDVNGDKTKLEIELPEVEGMSGMASGVVFSGDGEANATDDIVVNREVVIGDDGEILGGESGELGTAGETGVVSSEQIIISEAEAESNTSVDANDEGEVVSNIEFSTNGEADFQDSIRKFRIGDNDEVIIETTMNKVFRVDLATGELLKEYPIAEGEYAIGTSIVDGKVYIETNNGLNCYDLETGDSVALSESLTNQVSNSNSSDTNYMYADQGGLSIATKQGDPTGSLYLADNTGVYRQGEDGTVLELIIDASLTALSIPNTVISKLFALADDSFLVHAIGDDYKADYLYHYVYSAEAKATPESEIKVYSLEDNAEIRQAIALYQKANTDVMVTLQVGMTGEEGITISDALNTLNTEIMAGKGPDLLILDGMPIDSYVEKGILADISDVVDKVEEENGILEAVKDNHAIASRFSVPYVQSEAEYIDAIKNIETLGVVAKTAKEANPDKKSLSGYDINDMMKYLYKIYANNFITEDNKLDKEALQNFVEQVKGIVQDSQVKTAEEEASDDTLAISSESVVFGGVSEADAMTVTMELLFKEAIIGRGQIKTQNDLATIVALNEKMDWKYKLLTDSADENIILTNTILGINSKGEHIEEAKKFLGFCLGKEAQMSSQKMGLPVNREALSETLNQDFDEMGFVSMGMNDDGTTKEAELMIKKPSDEAIKEFENNILRPAKIGYSDRIVEGIVIEQLVNYFEERITLEEAVEAIDKKVSLYLAE